MTDEMAFAETEKQKEPPKIIKPIRCNHCGYTRQPDDNYVNEWECPLCQRVYDQYKKKNASKKTKRIEETEAQGITLNQLFDILTDFTIDIIFKTISFPIFKGCSSKKHLIVSLSSLAGILLILKIVLVSLSLLGLMLVTLKILIVHLSYVGLFLLILRVVFFTLTIIGVFLLIINGLSDAKVPLIQKVVVTSGMMTMFIPLVFFTYLFLFHEDPYQAVVNPHLQDKVLLFTTSRCSYSSNSIIFLKQNNIPFIEYNIESFGDAKKWFKEFNGKGVPFFVIRNSRFQGFQEIPLRKILVREGFVVSQ
ncbi:MAG: hypothetical protein HQK77_03775 [Desulfobacterales bacterium]|nr:hypothetical protein [Desulfobacterales bacterium]